MDMSQVQFIGYLVLGLAALIGLYKYFSDYFEKSHSIYNRINENLIKNTLAIENLNNYITKMEEEVKSRLDDHERRLDHQHDDIVDIKHKIGEE